MKDRPIIFSGPMIRALLSGGKKQTRRILKTVPASPGDDNINPRCQIKHDHAYLDSYRNGKRSPQNPGKMSENWCWWTRDDRQCLPTFKVPFVPGDRLWVREAWAPLEALTHNDHGTQALINGAFFRADEGTVDGEIARWYRSIHMPRNISRLTLAVTEVRVQRLQEITEGDARAEGIERLKSGRGYYDPTVSHAAVRFGRYFDTARDAFMFLWDAIHGEGAWAENPWIAAVSFAVHPVNVDRMPKLSEETAA